ncbi:insulinase family protein [Rathayibacter tanaceti]|uniref:Insulinase (Peptidase family M16) n=1 Tax=Rathayibacter tanaceti TaxID=1671680 RepID=A0A162J2S7_9MICO|nr:insulinase family protein [Rathayibacter tanaceti]KZX21357.1 Insulinase (Peptidase family M16) [Rathayibacter tanaceti]
MIGSALTSAGSSGPRTSIAEVPGARSVAVTLAVGAGSVDERPGEAGAAHLAEHLLYSEARLETGRLAEQFVLHRGGVSNAQSYPFHTEYSVVLPVEDDTLAVLGEAADVALARASLTEVPVAAIERERWVIAREIEERRTDGALATFPWNGALATRGRQRTDDSFTTPILAPDESWASSAACTPRERSLSVSPRRSTRTSSRRSSPRSSRSCPRGAPFRTGDRGSERSGRCAGGSCPAACPRPPRPASCRSAVPRERERAIAAVLARAVDAASPGAHWRAGLFGVHEGPETALLIGSSSVAGPAPDRPASTLPDRLDLDRLDVWRRAELHSLQRRLSGTATASSLLARDRLFGLDTRRTAAELTAVRAGDVAEAFDHLRRDEPGFLVWEHGEGEAA